MSNNHDNYQQCQSNNNKQITIEDWWEFTDSIPSEQIEINPDIKTELDRFFSENHQKENEDQSSGKSYFPSSVISEQLNDSLMNEVLSNKDSEYRANVLRIAYKAGVEKDDPLFAVLLATGQLEQLLHQKPTEINALFHKWQENWRSDLDYAGALFTAERDKWRTFIRETEKTLNLQSQAALDVQNQNISDSVTYLVREAAFQKVAHNASALICAAMVLLAAMGIGVVVGLAIPKFISPPKLDPTGIRQLTLDEAKALDWGLSEGGRFARENPELIQWAKSKEGKYAREFMQWNQTLLSGNSKRVCERQVEALGITLQLEGREAKNGFCTLWIKPPHERKFVF
jgi:hypothetical protein